MFAFTLRVPCRQKLGGYHALISDQVSPPIGFGAGLDLEEMPVKGNITKTMVPLLDAFQLCAFKLMTFSHHAWPLSAANRPDKGLSINHQSTSAYLINPIS